MNEPASSWLRPFALGLAVLAIAVGAKVAHDRGAAGRVGADVGASFRRDLGREALAPGCEARPVASVLFDGVGRAAVMRADGTTAAPDAIEVAEAGGGPPRAALAFDAAVPPDGYAALDVPVEIGADAARFADLALCVAGPGEALLLQIALERAGDPRRWVATNALVALETGWTTVRVPLLRWLDGDGLPWDAAPGSYDLVLTLLPFAGGRDDTLTGRFALARVALEDPIPPVAPRRGDAS